MSGMAVSAFCSASGVDAGASGKMDAFAEEGVGAASDGRPGTFGEFRELSGRSSVAVLRLLFFCLLFPFVTGYRDQEKRKDNLSRVHIPLPLLSTNPITSQRGFEGRYH